MTAFRERRLAAILVALAVVVGVRRKRPAEPMMTNDVSTSPRRDNLSALMRVVATTTLSVVVLVAGCGKSDGNNQANTPGGQGKELHFGHAPAGDSKIEYQSDVVVVSGGGGAVKSATDSGLVWTIDGKAAGADKLEVGKVMLLTASAAGRVVKVDKVDGDVKVVLAPVQLTEVIRNGHLSGDFTIDSSSMAFQPFPEMPGAFTDLAPVAATATPTIHAGDDTIVLALPPMQLLAETTAAAPVPAPDTVSDEVSQKINSWNVAAYRKRAGDKTNALGVKLARAGTLKATIDLSLVVENLHVVPDIAISNGTATTSNFRVEGLKGLKLKVEGGAANGLADNKQVKIEFPIELKTPVVLAGMPFVFSQKYKMIFKTAFSAKNSTLSSFGDWDLVGALGYSGGELHVPKITEKVNMTDELKGVSVGANGIVVAAEARFQFGLGVMVASAGPYVKLILTLGMTDGSDLGIVKCKNAVLTLSAGGGLGINASETMTTALQTFFGGLLNTKLKTGDEFSVGTKEIFKKNRSLPDVPACQL